MHGRVAIELVLERIDLGAAGRVVGGRKAQAVAGRSLHNDLLYLAEQVVVQPAGHRKVLRAGECLLVGVQGHGQPGIRASNAQIGPWLRGGTIGHVREFKGAGRILQRRQRIQDRVGTALLARLGERNHREGLVVQVGRIAVAVAANQAARTMRSVEDERRVHHPLQGGNLGHARRRRADEIIRGVGRQGGRILRQPQLVARAAHSAAIAARWHAVGGAHRVVAGGVNGKEQAVGTRERTRHRDLEAAVGVEGRGGIRLQVVHIAMRKQRDAVIGQRPRQRMPARDDRLASRGDNIADDEAGAGGRVQGQFGMGRSAAHAGPDRRRRGPRSFFTDKRHDRTNAEIA